MYVCIHVGMCVFVRVFMLVKAPNGAGFSAQRASPEQPTMQMHWVDEELHSPDADIHRWSEEQVSFCLHPKNCVLELRTAW